MALGVMTLAVWLARPAAALAQLGADCTASIQNRTIQVSADSTFIIPNVPVDDGLYRVRVVCTRPDGTVVAGQSPFIALSPPRDAISIDNIQFGVIDPIPVAVAVTAPANALHTPGETLQLIVTATMPDNTTRELTTRALGTTYSTSNPRIATVSQDGLVRAVARGRVVVSARNEGAIGAITLDIDLVADADGDGMSDDYERLFGLDPNNPLDAADDPDNDGLTNLQESRLGTNPHLADTDGDGLPDGLEVRIGSNPLVADTDGDGLLDGAEVSLGTSPVNADTDGDTIPDGVEVQLGLNPLRPDPITTAQGRVVDEQGFAVLRASVIVLGPFTAVTDNSGFFTVTGVPASLGPLTAIARIVRDTAVLEGRSTPTVPVPAGVTALGTIRVSAATGTVTGLIQDPNGRPVAGAGVTLTASNDSRATTSDATGRYRFDRLAAGVVVVIAESPATGLRARRAANLDPNSGLALDLILSPSGTVTGRVLGRDGITPVGAGADVSLAVGAVTVGAAVTDTLGRYLFDFVPLGELTLDASDANGNRGRSTGVLSATGQRIVTDIGFLGRGAVQGTVRDAAGAPVANAAVTLTSGSPFGGVRTATTTPTGQYSIANVFVGEFGVTVRSAALQSAGRTAGALLQDGTTVTADVALAASATIEGTVLRADGATAFVGRVRLSNGLTADTDQAGFYRFTLVPLGDYSLDVTDSSGERGTAAASLAAQDQVATVNIRLTGVGTVNVTVQDAAGVPSSGAEVTLTTSALGGVASTLFTNDAGRAVFQRVLAGELTADARVSALGLSGSASGALAAGNTVDLVIGLTPAGTITGTVVSVSGAPTSSVTVLLSGPVTRTVLNPTGGQFRFDTVPVGTYVLDALDAFGNVRGRASNVAVTTQGQTVTRNITLLGEGVVTGIVTSLDGAPQQGLVVRIASGAPGFNGQFEARTDVTGRYRATGVPLGAFTASTLRVIDAVTSASGSASGVLQRDGETATANIQISTALVPTVRTLNDANDFTYDLRENGTIQTGTRQIYAGDGAANSRGEALDVTVGGVTTRFAGQTLGLSLQNGREIAIQQSGLGGLSVTRKVFVPRDGYFARYLEILTNLTRDPIVADVRVTSHFRFIRRAERGFTFDHEPRIVTTSSGDASVDSGDVWAIVDDDLDGDAFLLNTLPSTAHVFGGAESPTPVGQADFTIDFASRFGRLSHEWRQVTVPSGGRVAFMHFASQQTGRTAARTAAERLTALPPEVFEGGTAEDLYQAFRRLQITLSFLSGVTCGPDSADAHFAQAEALEPLVLAARTSTNVSEIVAVALAVRDLAQAAYNQDAISIDLTDANGHCILFGDITRQEVTPAIDVPSDLIDLAAVANFALSPGNRSTLPALPSLRGTISGRTLTWDGGAVITGAPVTYQSSNPLFGRLRFLTSDSQSGIFTVESRTFPVPVEGFVLGATHPQTAVTAPNAVGLFDEGALAATQDVMFTNTGNVNGTVRRGSNVVASAGQVNVTGVELPSPFSVGIAQSGDFLVSGLKDGNYGLTAAVPTLQGTTLFGSNAARSVVAQTTRADIVLEPSGSVTGIVRRENGAVAGGLAVQLRSTGRSETTFTSTSGQYSFVDAPTGPAVVEVYDAVTNTAASAQLDVAADQVTTRDLTLVFGGTVTGAVRVRGVLTAGVAVTLDALGGTRAASSGADGTYRFDRVTPGAVSVRAQDPVSGLQASVTGTLGLSGDTLTLDLNLIAAGTITGTVRRSDLSGPLPGARVTLSYNAIADTFTTIANAIGEFAFTSVPIGAFTLDAIETDTGDRGRASSQLSANGETRTVDIRLSGLGAVTVRVRDAVGNPVGTAQVSLRSNTIFGGDQTASTRDDGIAPFPQVLAGPFSVSVFDFATSESASATGSVTAGGVTDIALTIGSAATITGIVTAPDGVTPAPGVTVRVNGSAFRQVVTGPDGVYRVDGLPLGTFTVEVFDGAGRLRAQQTGLAITSIGQVLTVNLRLVGGGRVTGTVRNPDSTPAFEAFVELRSLNPEVGGFFTARTDSDGTYAIANVPVGPFNAVARDVSQLLFGETTGAIASDGEEVTADIQLLDNSTYLPVYRYDANDAFFDLEGSGGIGYGFNSVFYGDSGANRGGFLLDITANGTTTRFDGGSVGTLEFGGQQVVTRQQVAGLNVTRKAFVPPSGYFARFLEELQNPTPNPVAVDVVITSNFSPFFSGGPRVVGSSSGDAVLDISDPTTRDRWVVVDDASAFDPYERGNEPPVAALFDGSNAPVQASQASFSRVGTGPGLLRYGWNNLTVPPNGSVALLHFGVQQLTPAAAIASAMRLDQLPPEALAGLTAGEIAQVQNFVLPANGISSVAPFDLTGHVSGLVLEADGSTLVPGGEVTFRSTNPIFGRLQRTTSTNFAAFSFDSQVASLDGSSHVPVPVEPFVLGATHPQSGGAAPAVNGSFPPGTSSVGQNVVFTGTGAIRGTVRRHTGEPVTTGGYVSASASAPSFSEYATIGSDGSYVAGGLSARAFALTAFVFHPQGNPNEGTATAPVVVGQTTLQDIILTPTGSLAGTVRNADGTPASSVFVQLSDASGSFYRYTYSDISGAYLLTDIPQGTYLVTVYEPRTSIRTTMTVSIVRDVTRTQDLVLIGLGTLSIQVVRASGAPAANSDVYINESVTGYLRYLGRTDVGGTLVADPVAVGPFTLQAYHPDNTNLIGQTSGIMPSNGAVASITVTLPPTGIVTGRVTLASGAAVAGAYVTVTDTVGNGSQYAQTDGFGVYTITSVPAGRTLTIRAQHPSNGLLVRQVSSQIGGDGQTLTQDLVLPALATVRVTVLRADQTPLAGATVDIRDSRSTSFRSGGTTDSNGVVSITSVLEGDFTVRARSNGVFAGSATGTVRLADDGQIVPITINPPVQGTVQGTITAGDGLTPVARAFVEAYIADSGDFVASATANDTGAYSLTGVTAGVSGVRVIAHLPNDFATSATRTATIEAGQTVVVNLTLPASVITGRVLKADAVTVVTTVSALARQTLSDGTTRTYTSTLTNAQGTWFIYGVPPGAVTITGQDSRTGLSASVTGTVASITEPLVVDVVLPPTGSVTGTVRTADGLALSAARVAIISNASTFVRTAVADATGVYTFSDVAVGPAWVQGCNTTQICGVGAGVVATADASAVVDISLPGLGSVAGSVFGTDGVTPVPQASAVIESFANGGPLTSVFRRTATADAAGQYSFAGVPAGPLTVTASSSGVVGMADGAVTTGATSTMNVVLGTAVNVPFKLDGADGFRYDVSCDGTLSDGGTVDRSLNDAYDGAYGLLVAGTRFPCVSAALTEESGRQLRLGASASTILHVVRKIFVPSTGGFARFLETISNPTDVVWTVLVEIQSNLGSDSATRVVVAPADTGFRYFVTDQRASCCDPALGHVISGVGASVVPTTAGVTGGNDQIATRWLVTVPARGSAIVMHFAVQRGFADAAGAQAEAELLSALSDPDALTGLTAEERQAIVNFVVR